MPRTIVEVLLPSTPSYHLVDKLSAYRGLDSLEAYVIIRSDVRRVEVDRHGPRGQWHSDTIDDGDVLFGGTPLSLDAIYAETAIASTT